MESFGTFMIRLEAINPARNAYRRYEVRVTRDLFDWWQVEITNGRIGSPGQRRLYGARDEASARKIVDQALKRRRGSVGRIGVAYEIVEAG